MENKEHDNSIIGTILHMLKVNKSLTDNYVNLWKLNYLLQH